MITIYDTEFNVLPGRTISPFVAKVRIALKYKNIPHKTVWLEFSRFAPQAAELGLPLNDTDNDDPPRYKVPIIHDSETGQTVCDSTRIILYLERTYPNTPRIIPPGAEALAVAFDTLVRQHVSGVIVPSVSARLALLLDDSERRRISFVQIIEAAFLKMPLDEFIANPEHERAVWEKAESQFDVVNKLLEKAKLVTNGSEVGIFMGGNTLTYADLCLGAVLYWARTALGTEGEEHWQRLAGWNEGRWVRLHEALKVYTANDGQ
ncbi:hypothetical protein NMY22_g16235 [Coprinellus aureogranulatus]|nr:hypothetical protein NMY22_g16235 [Coprinellus aureogranulatus]